MAYTTPTPKTDFDARLGSFLDWQAGQTADAPPADEVALRIAARGRLGRPAAAYGRLAWVLIVLAVSVALMAATAWFASRPPALLPSTTPTPSVSPAPSTVNRVQPADLAGTVAVAVGRGDLVAINPLTNRLTNLVLCDDPCNGLSSPAWSPDGNRLAYLVPVMSTDGFAAPKRGIWIKDFATGSTTELVPCTQPADCALDRPLAWSPDGKWIAFFQRSALAIAPVDGEPVRTVINVGALDPTMSSLSVSWSPDSQRLNFTTQSGQWESVNIDGHAHEVHPTPTFVWLAVSPDESQIAYVTEEPNPAPVAQATPLSDPFAATLWTAHADGSNASQVAALPGCCLGAWVGAPAWSADGSQLAWAGYSETSGTSDVYIAGAGQEAWHFAQVAPNSPSRPAWAPGPTPLSPKHLIPTPEPLPTLVARSSVGPSNCPAMDTVADSIGATDGTIAPTSAAPAGQPKNGSIVVSLAGQVGIDAFVGTLAPDFSQGASPQKVLSVASDDGMSALSDFAWSPDGSEFAFTASDGIEPDASAGSAVTFSCGTLFAASSDGTSPRRLLPPATGYGVMAPAWSPDGTRIAYLSYQAPAGRALAEPPVFRSVRVLDLRDGLDQAIGPCSGCTALEWSLDGALIAGVGPTAGGVEIVSASTDRGSSSADATRVLDDADAIRWIGRDLLVARVSDDGSTLSITRVHTASQPYQIDLPQTISAPVGTTFANRAVAFDSTGQRLAVAIKNGSFDPSAQIQLGTVDSATRLFTPANAEAYATGPDDVLWSPDGTDLLFESPIGVLERVRAGGTPSDSGGLVAVEPGLHGFAWQPTWP